MFLLVLKVFGMFQEGDLDLDLAYQDLSLYESSN